VIGRHCSRSAKRPGLYVDRTAGRE